GSLEGLHAIDARKGTDLWSAPNAIQFVSAGKKRVYCGDKLGRLLMLDSDTGAKLDVMPAADFTIKMINSATDRLYLATRTGLIVCLREAGLTKPIRYDEQIKAAIAAATQNKKSGKASSEKAVKPQEN
ncbi:MAG: hypothetical protein ACWGMZ_06280, partial [Thermoguttaceae bacterium]